MTEKRLKNILIRSCKTYLTYDNNFGGSNKVICFKNISEFHKKWTNFWVIYSPNKYSDIGPALNYRIRMLLILVPPWKRNLFKIVTTMKIKSEHMFKSYDWISIKHIYIYIYIYIQTVYSFSARLELKLIVVKNS